MRLQAWKQPLERFSLMLCLPWKTCEWLLAHQLPFWVAAFECFAEAVFSAGGEVPSSGLVVECPAFPQPYTWYLTASGFVLMWQRAEGADWMFCGTVRGESFSGKPELTGF